MINLDSITNENNKEHTHTHTRTHTHTHTHTYTHTYTHTHTNCHTPLIILIIGGSGSGKTNALINLINEQHDIDKIYLYATDLNKPKYQFLIKKPEDVGIKHVIDPNAFIECSDTMDDVYENIDDFNPSGKRKN